MRPKSPSVATRPPSAKMHARNAHQGRYDFVSLVQACPALAAFVLRNPDGEETINFADAAAVKTLNRALLKMDYGVVYWDIPDGYLCPPIPGRADYLHCLADLLARDNGGAIPRGKCIHVLDIGVGANCVYPLIGQASYGWRFVGSDIDQRALNNAQQILDANGELAREIELRLQPSSQSIFDPIMRAGEHFDLTLCNPPFHPSAASAQAGSQRKWGNLGHTHKGKAVLNFGGRSAELWCPGGEEGFVRRMIEQSAKISDSCLWFSSLVSKSANLPSVYRALKRAGARQNQTLAMAQGQKQSRLVAWTFLDEAQHSAWRKHHW